MKRTYIIRDGQLVEKAKRRDEVIDLLPWPDGTTIAERMTMVQRVIRETCWKEWMVKNKEST